MRGGLRSIVLAWLPLRAGLLMALYLHRVLRSDPQPPLARDEPFLLAVDAVAAVGGAGAVGLAIRAAAVTWDEGPSDEGDEAKPSGTNARPVRPPPSAFRLPRPSRRSPPLIALAVALFTAAIYWNPVGSRREGRVMVVERHSEWEPTTKPYDTTWFAEPRLFGEASGYNYAAIYDYLGQFYQMSRLLESDKIDDQTLGKCDVLVIKIPTERYSKDEAEAVVRFVERGGGLLLIGDHTNFEGSATAMNDITRPMGFIFRDDLLFSFGESPDEESYERPLVPHPSVQHVPRVRLGRFLLDRSGPQPRPVGHHQHRPVEHGPRISQRQLSCPFPSTARKCATGRSCKSGRPATGKAGPSPSPTRRSSRTSACFSRARPK